MPLSRNRALISRQVGIAQATHIVAYLTPEEVMRLGEAAGQNRKGDRDRLLVRLLFETGLRISEALGLTLAHLDSFEGRPVFKIVGKGKTPRLVACPARLSESFQAYAFRHELKSQDKLFPVNRKRAHQIIKEASQRAGLTKRVYPHLLRHSDAIERLRQTGNPKALQHHLGHKTMLMTMRYLSTLQEEDSLRIQQQVEFDY